MFAGRVRATFLLGLGAAACATSRAPAPNLTLLIAPSPPLTVADTVARLALRRAVAALWPPTNHRVIVTRLGASLTPRALPDSVGLSFVILPREAIQRVADEQGDFYYLEVYSIAVHGDTATVSIALESAFSRPLHGGSMLAGSTFCEWVAVRQERGWTVNEPRNCLIADLMLAPPNQRLKLSARGGRVKGNTSVLSAAAAGRSLSAIR
jgi:hypothetical protein